MGVSFDREGVNADQRAEHTLLIGILTVRTPHYNATSRDSGFVKQYVAEKFK